MVEILQGDCVSLLRAMPEQSVNCCVTSPPYFGLRDYGHDGQIGLEATPDEFVAKLVSVFREVRRVLRDDGTLWLNLGDSYAGSGRGAWNISDEEKKARGVKETYLPKVRAGGSGLRSKPSAGFHENAVQAGSIGRAWVPPPGLKQKDLIGIPWRVAFALQADGWYLRQDIIWHKPNPMPESVRDRCTKAHEYIFLLAKSERYYFDSEAMREPLANANAQRTTKHYNTAERYGAGNGGNSGLDELAARMRSGEVTTRNRRSVWTVATRPFKGAHFATFPPDLIEPCVLAGCPAGGTVLDPFGGSGTTGLVASRNGRNAILCELNPEYVAIARQRIGLQPTLADLL